MECPKQQYPKSYVEANNSASLYAATTIIMVLCTVLLSLRMYARSLTEGHRGWDDYFLIPSWMFLMCVCVVMFISIPKAGVGRHSCVVFTEDPHKWQVWNFIIYLLDWFYVPSNMFSRVSVVALYLRIFRSRTARCLCWAVIAFLVGNCVAILISANLECIPLQRTWNKKIQGRCFNVELWWKLANIPNVVADVAILLLPLQTIWNLKATMFKKAGLWFVCLTGSIGLVASCMRTSQFFSALDSKSPDPAWSSSPLLVWTVVECGMYNAAACLVCLRPLYSRLPKFIRDRWTALDHSKLSSGAVKQVSWKPDRSWSKIAQGNDTESTLRVKKMEVGEDIELSEPSNTKGSGAPRSSALNSISVDRTFEVKESTVAV